MPFFQVKGYKSSTIGPEHERNGRTLIQPIAQEWVPIILSIFCRIGDEVPIKAARGTRCGTGCHGVKEGKEVYRLGRGYTCADHLKRVQTRDQVTDQYSGIYFKDIEITEIT